MTVIEDNNNYNMQLTLERHLDDLAQRYPAVRDIRSLWTLFRKRLEDELTQSRSTFTNYSLHDGSHSRSVIQAIERFLGEDRICKLSATDTFMLLACTYAHDYGMAQTFNKIYDILGTDEFEHFLKKVGAQPDKLDKDERWAVNNLLSYVDNVQKNVQLNDIYFSIILVIQLYLRPNHWRGVAEIRQNFEGLFSGQIKKRFIYGSEGIIEICMCHGQSMEEVLKLAEWADGMAGDDYHPRFVAAMLRLGDLLDIDNGRFPTWFVSEIARDRNIIPKLSVLHFKKHESISHLLITPAKIEIMAQCNSKSVEKLREVPERKRDVELEKARKECYEVASLVSEWAVWLYEECHQLVLHWNEIAQPHFGGPPANVKVSIYVDGKEFMAEDKVLQMKMSQERVMTLLEGTNIYRDKYVGIREMIQNAIDASLLQLWSDLIQNRYRSQGLSKDVVLGEEFDLLTFMDPQKAAIFGNYDIIVEVIKDMLRGKVFIVVKDRGIGITAEEVKYIADIGSSREENDRVRRLMETMPAWLKPSGAFGIGLQSVFQLTDCVEFYTRQHNEPERMISMYSYGKNKGKIEAWEMPESEEGLYNDNAIPGTNVKIAVEPEKLLGSEEKKKHNFKYYDPIFDEGEEMHMIFAEICRRCEEIIKETPIDYFNVIYESKIINEDGEKEKPEKENPEKENPEKEKPEKEKPEKENPEKENPKRHSYITHTDWKKQKKSPKYLQYFCNVSEEGYSFTNNTAFFWDKKANRCYTLKVRPCKIIKGDEKNELSLPEKVSSLYKVSYKFNVISDAETIYEHRGSSQQSHAGLSNLEVLILDDKPQNYMNIDRDRLREGAIDEGELLAIRSEILKRWCEYFCNEGVEKKEKAKQEAQTENSKTKGKKGKKPKEPTEPKACLAGEKEILFSLILLFYQNVSEAHFKKFMKPYKELVKDLNLFLEKENIPVTDLWNPEKQFQVGVPVAQNIQNDNSELTERQQNEMLLQNICRLPHRLVHIEEINKSEDMLWYHLRLKKPGKEVAAIEMKPEARLHDYMKAFDVHKDNNSKVDFQSVIKKVFKPDKQYEALLVPDFPQTFRRGHNLENGLDHCISWYILSPFDRDAISQLKTAINEREKAQEEKAAEEAKKRKEEEQGEKEVSLEEQKEGRKEEKRETKREIKSDKEIVDSLTEYVMSNSQLKKCVSYIMKKREPQDGDVNKQREKITEQYKEFVENFFTTLIEKWDIVKTQYKEYL